MEDYLAKKVYPILEEFVTAVIRDKPDNVREYLRSHLQERADDPLATDVPNHGEVSKVDQSHHGEVSKAELQQHDTVSHDNHSLVLEADAHHYGLNSEESMAVSDGQNHALNSEKLLEVPNDDQTYVVESHDHHHQTWETTIPTAENHSESNTPAQEPFAAHLETAPVDGWMSVPEETVVSDDAHHQDEVTAPVGSWDTPVDADVVSPSVQAPHVASAGTKGWDIEDDIFSEHPVQPPEIPLSAPCLEQTTTGWDVEDDLFDVVIPRDKVEEHVVDSLQEGEPNDREKIADPHFLGDNHGSSEEVYEPQESVPDRFGFSAVLPTDPLRAFLEQAQAHSHHDEDEDIHGVISPTASQGGLLSPTHSPSNIERYLKQGARISIPAESTDDISRRFEDGQKSLMPKSESERDEILKLFKSSILFENKLDEDVAMIIDAMTVETIPDPDTNVPVNSSIVFIGSGEIETEKVCKGKSEIQLNLPGDIIGELTGLYRCECEIVRMTTCDWDTKIWRIERDFFDYLIRSTAQKKRERHLQLLSSVPILSTMDWDDLRKISDAVKQERFENGSFIAHQGEMGNTFFIIESGTCLETGNTAAGRELHRGDFFGEVSLIRNEPRAYDVIAHKGNVTVLALDRLSFKRLLGPIEKLLLRDS